MKGYATKVPKGMLEVGDFDLGPLGADEVEVRVTHCGICGSDIAMIDNDWGFSTYPLVPGHEVIGIITVRSGSGSESAGWRGLAGHVSAAHGAKRTCAMRHSSRLRGATEAGQV